MNNIFPFIVLTIALFVIYRLFKKAVVAKREKLIDRYPFPPSIATKVMEKFPHSQRRQPV